MSNSNASWLGYDWFKLAVAILLLLLLLVFRRAPLEIPASSDATATAINTTGPTSVPPDTTPHIVLDQPTASDTLTAGPIVFSGTADAGTRVRVQAAGSPLGETTAASSGSWSLTADLPAGQTQVVAQALDASGAVLAETAPLTLQVTPAAAQPNAPAITQPTTDDDLTAGSISFSGTADPGILVKVFGETLLAETTAAADGTWSATAELPAGDLEVFALALDEASGLSTTSPTLQLTIAPAAEESTIPALTPTPGPVAPSRPCGQGKITRAGYVVANCENLTRISRILNVTLNDLLRANPQITNPDLIFPGQVLKIP